MGKKMRPDHHDDAYRAFQAQRWAYEAELEERTGERGAVSSRSGKSEGTGTAMSQADSNPRRTQEEFGPTFPLRAAREGKEPCYVPGLRCEGRRVVFRADGQGVPGAVQDAHIAAAGQGATAAVREAWAEGAGQ